MPLTEHTENKSSNPNIKEQCPTCGAWELMASKVQKKVDEKETKIDGWNCGHCKRQFTGSPE